MSSSLPSSALDFPIPRLGQNVSLGVCSPAPPSVPVTPQPHARKEFWSRLASHSPGLSPAQLLRPGPSPLASFLPQKTRMNHTTSPTALSGAPSHGLWISSLVVQFSLDNTLSVLAIMRGVGPGIWGALDPCLSLPQRAPCGCCHQILPSLSLKNVMCALL